MSVCVWGEREEEESHRECSPGVVAAALLPSEQKYLLFTKKTALDFLFFFLRFWKRENNETYQSKLIAEDPASFAL